MKQKTSNNAGSDLVTKDYFKKELKKELSKEISKLATKKELKQLEKSLREELLRLEGRIEQSDDNAREYRDQILTKLDGVMGELQTMREENTIGAYQISQLREEVDGHEKRIGHLEKSRQTA